MKIYNTLTKKKEEFVPLEEGKDDCEGFAVDFRGVSAAG